MTRLVLLRLVAGVLGRVEHCEKTSLILRIRKEQVKYICNLESKLFLLSILSVRILNMLEVIGKKSSSKISKRITQYKAIVDK